MRRLRWFGLLMGIVILVIAGFQVYWLKDNYAREKVSLETKTNVLFSETVREMQDSLVQARIQRAMKDTVGRINIEMAGATGRIRTAPRRPDATRVINILGNRLRADSMRKAMKKQNGLYLSMDKNSKAVRRDSARVRFLLDSVDTEKISEVMVFKGPEGLRMMDSVGIRRPASVTAMKTTMPRSDSFRRSFTYMNTISLNDERGDRVMIRIDSLFNDSIRLDRLSDRFTETLKQENLSVPFTVSRDSTATFEETSFRGPVEFAGFSGYRLSLGNTMSFILKEISLPILFSFFLVGITIFSFILLYRSLLKQHRLAQMKNDLISNITHELKTPIATVGVAIEALKNFNAIQDPARTKEYLDISQNELQRLALLVDKVLKLSMFENKEIEIRQEIFNLDDVVNEVVASLRLQLEKYNARISVNTEGNMTMKGDRLHMLSVVFNLLDNALKYSKGDAAIKVDLRQQDTEIIMRVTDNGIGIPNAYRDKVFEKFFRVPTGDTHNAKGHGLGLSYVAKVIRQHNGKIELDSHEGLGTTFTISLPTQGT